MSRLEEAAAKACCADLYQSDLARLILGDTRHPGGLRLTHRLGRLMGLRRDDWVVDLASGNGASASAISRAFHCRVVGIEYGRAAALEAREKARVAPIPGQAAFIQGDAEQPPLRAGRFDAVFAECSLSLFPDKAKAVGGGGPAAAARRQTGPQRRNGCAGLPAAGTGRFPGPAAVPFRRAGRGRLYRSAGGGRA